MGRQQGKTNGLARCLIEQIANQRHITERLRHFKSAFSSHCSMKMNSVIRNFAFKVKA